MRICDLAGRPRGSGFVADDCGTVVTSHEAVDGLARVVLHGPGERTWLADAPDVTALPECGLALVRTDGLGVRPLPVAIREDVAPGTYVRLPARGWRQARVLGPAEVTYTATDRFHMLPAALELAIGTDGQDALRLGGEACGGPVLDAGTGAVLAVLGTALQAEHRSGGFAVPLAAAAAADPDGPLAVLLRRNAATVPGYGCDLNLAGGLELTGTTLGAAFASRSPEPVDRPAVAAELDAFASGDRLVLALVGHPGTGRTTALSALAVRRAGGACPAPTLWLRGADLRSADASLADAVARALAEAARIVATAPAPATAAGAADGGGGGGGGGRGTGERVAWLARRAGRALVVVLDAPEEMPAELGQGLGTWTEGTVRWLRETGARLVVAARPEHWEQAGALYPPEVLHVPARPARRLPSAVPIGDFTPAEAERARARLGVPADAVRESDSRHPLTLHLLAGVRAAEVTDGRPGREEVFGAHLDLMCLRVAVRIAAAGAALLPRPREAGPGGPGTGSATRTGPAAYRLGTDTDTGAVAYDRGTAKAARPGSGATAYGTGVGTGPAAYRPSSGAAAGPAGFGPGPGPDPGTGRSAAYGAGVGTGPAAYGAGSGHGAVAGDCWGGGVAYGPGVGRLAARVAGQVHEAARRCLGPGRGALDRAAFEDLFPWRTGWASAVLTEGLLVPAGPGYRFAHEELADWLQSGHLDLPAALAALEGPGHSVPRHRIGPVLEALRRLASDEAGPHLMRLVRALNADPAPEPAWWAGRLLRETLLRAPTARPHLPVLHALAEHIAHTGRQEEFDGWFWNRLRLPESDRLDLLRRMLPSDHRYLDAAARRLVRDPRLAQPLLCAWFTDERRLLGRPRATVATAAQALLHTHRGLAVDDLTEALVTAAHPRADELLTVLAEDEPSALCRAVDRWAHDERPGRRVAAAAYGLATAPHVRTPADRELLRYAAQTLLSRPGDATLHGSALGMLLRDPQVRARYLPDALSCFRDPDRGSRLPASALVAALPVLPDPDAVFAALRARADGEVVRALAALTTPGLARRAGDLVREHLARNPQDAPHAAAFVDRRLEQGLAAAPVLRPLVLDLLRSGPPVVRAELAAVLAAPGGEPSYTLRGELADVLLREETDPVVLEAFLGAVAEGAAGRPEARSRELLRRTGRQLLRAPGGPAVFERRTVELARSRPAFGALAAQWLAEAGTEAAALLGPGARRALETLGRGGPGGAAPA
ncbi:serine protease [Streptomyces sp. NPDC048340]|uniref:serine protease n=1 Tax=Streptomyces sp. NPDC048340 TaxID=3365537 RepID=UPI003712CD3D